MRRTNHQTSLKPQDFLLAVKVALRGSQLQSYAAIAAELSMSVSEVHGSAKRAQLSRLLSNSSLDGLAASRSSLREFAVHGVKYAFPAIVGPMGRGMPTSYGGPSLRKEIVQAGDDVPVWPHPAGQVRGPILYPLYPSVPSAAEKDEALYDLLTLVDAVRMGAARERERAATLIIERLS